eukprot:SAG22_NODE_6222_length_884_cov_0.797452_1_plen_101_part_00
MILLAVLPFTCAILLSGCIVRRPAGAGDGEVGEAPSEEAWEVARLQAVAALGGVKHMYAAPPAFCDDECAAFRTRLLRNFLDAATVFAATEYGRPGGPVG